jgi:hypothetical protein
LDEVIVTNHSKIAFTFESAVDFPNVISTVAVSNETPSWTDGVFRSLQGRSDDEQSERDGPKKAAMLCAARVLVRKVWGLPIS